MKQLFAIIVVDLLLIACSTQTVRSGQVKTTPVQTNSGAVTGEVVDGLQVYRGIPYASPPVGERRWQKPIPPPSWQEPRPMTKFGAVCPQPESNFIRYQGQISEDCLTLNIWTPARRKTDRLPVMVWLHGGGFFLGSSAETIYEGSALAKKGVVVVTLNYRLGALGFLAHPALTTESANGSSGNYGIMDQIFALKWVRDNIRHFGGDPNNVTIFGQSAGAVSVTALMASPETEGLFHRAIAQSGEAPTILRCLKQSRPNLESMESLGLKLAQKLGVTNQFKSLRVMRTKSWQAIVNAWGDTLKETSIGDAMAGAGTANHLSVDGYILKQLPGNVFAAGQQQAIPFMTGTVADEGAVFAGKLRINTLRAYTRFLRRFFGSRLARKYFELYPANDNSSAHQAVRDLISDKFVLGVRTTAKDMAAIGAETYLYQFSHVSQLAARRRLGSYHGSELSYLFQVFPKNMGFDADDLRLSEQMGDYWTQFARSGNPNNGEPHWPVFDSVRQDYLILDQDIKAGEQLLQKRLDTLESLEKLSAPQGVAQGCR